MVKNVQKSNPSKLKYIFAFIVTNLVTNMFASGSSQILFQGVSDFDSLEKIYILHNILFCLYASGFFIVSYQFIFKNLNVRKIMIYMYIFTPIGVLLGLGKLISEFQTAGIDLPSSTFKVIIFSSIFSVIFFLLVIRFFFKSRPEKWF